MCGVVSLVILHILPVWQSREFCIGHEGGMRTCPLIVSIFDGTLQPQAFDMLYPMALL